MSATDELRRLLDERGVEYSVREDSWGKETYWIVDHCPYRFSERGEYGSCVLHNLTPEQAIAATLGRPKAKAHPYGYEPDTGAFDVTRCECGCLNDISATYCNDCGGVIEVDMNAEKEIYRTPRHLVFAEKHDDGSLEFGGERYIAATLGSGTLTAEQVRKAIFDGSSYASYDGAKYYADGIGMQAIADELNSRAERTCHIIELDSLTQTLSMANGCEWGECSLCGCLTPIDSKFCIECGAKVIEEEE